MLETQTRLRKEGINNIFINMLCTTIERRIVWPHNEMHKMNWKKTSRFFFYLFHWGFFLNENNQEKLRPNECSVKSITECSFFCFWRLAFVLCLLSIRCAPKSMMDFFFLRLLCVHVIVCVCECVFDYWVIWFSSISYVILFLVYLIRCNNHVQLNTLKSNPIELKIYFLFFFCCYKAFRIHPVFFYWYGNRNKKAHSSFFRISIHSPMVITLQFHLRVRYCNAKLKLLFKLLLYTWNWFSNSIFIRPGQIFLTVARNGKWIGNEITKEASFDCIGIHFEWLIRKHYSSNHAISFEIRKKY